MLPTKKYTNDNATSYGRRVESVVYATARAKARAKKYPGESGAKKLAARIGCGHISIYDWERVGYEHLPKNRFVRKAYLKAIGLEESDKPAAQVTP